MITENGEISPSSFIPFCDFGGNMTSMGVQIKQFKVPVCNSFQAEILNDQLCYQVDLKRFSNRENIEHELKEGFLFIMDYNEDRQLTFGRKHHYPIKEKNLISRIVKSDDEHHAHIYLNTVGR